MHLKNDLCDAVFMLNSHHLHLTSKHQISLGDVQSNYLLTTAENELGVVVAQGKSGTSQCSVRHDGKITKINMNSSAVCCVNTRWQKVAQGLTLNRALAEVLGN